MCHVIDTFINLHCICLLFIAQFLFSVIFDQIMQTLILVPLNPLSETLFTLCELRGGAAGYPGRGCAHARCSPAMKISRFVSDSLGGLGASVERRYWAQVLCPLHF